MRKSKRRNETAHNRGKKEGSTNNNNDNNGTSTENLLDTPLCSLTYS